MKRFIPLAAVAALMCGTSALAQTTTPDPSNPGDTGTTPTSENRPEQGTVTDSAAPASADPSMSNAGDPTTATTGATVTAGDRTAADTQSTTATDAATAATTTEGTADASIAPATTDPTAPTTAPTMSADSTTAMPAASGSANLASFDADSDGALTPLEFAQLVVAGRAPASGGDSTALVAEAKRERFSRASGNGAIKLLNDTGEDFGKADANRDMKVSGDELAMWSGGGSMAPATMAAPATAPEPMTAPAPATDPAMPTDPAAPPMGDMPATTPPTADAPATTPEPQ